MSSRSSLTLAALLYCNIIASVASAEPVALFFDEHVDMNVSYGGGTNFTLAFRDDDNMIQYKDDNAVVVLSEAAIVNRTSGSAFDFIGVPAGAPYYRLPQGQNPAVVYLGLAAYGVASDSIDSYDATTESGGRVSGKAAWVRLKLIRSSGPGAVSIWQSGVSPTAFVATSNGISNDDSLWIRAGSHVHFNYGFTAPGEYRVTFELSAFQGGLPKVSCPITVFFRVDISNNVALVRGTANLSNFLGKVSDQPLTVDLISGGSIVETQEIFPRCDGTFTLHTLKRGEFDIRAKGTHWLRQKIGGVSIPTDGVGGLAFMLTNGDIDGDNSVTVFDYDLLSQAFDSVPGDANWNATADLDGDGAVTVFDYDALSTNFDQMGDE